MWGSYGSYSSMSSTLSSAPMDIKSSYLHSHDAPCAFPSWPRRSSLDGSDRERPTAFLSDDDLFLGDPFDDDLASISSPSSSSSAASSPQNVGLDELTGEQILQMEMQRAAAMHHPQRDYVNARHAAGEKERRKQVRKAASKKSTHASSSKKSPKNKLTNMAPIAE